MEEAGENGVNDAAAYVKLSNDFSHVGGTGAAAQGPGFAAIQNHNSFGNGFLTKRSHK